MSDDPIRRAVHELVASAPNPAPLPDRDPAPLPGPRSYRWVAVAASAVLIVAGAVAIAAWPSGDSEAPISSDSTVTVTTGPVPQTTESPTSTTPSTSTASAPATTVPQSTQPSTTTSSTEPPPGDVTQYPVEVPAGSFVRTPDDLLITRSDGDLYLHPGALSAAPGDPVLLVDMGDPRAESEEGPGPLVVDAVAGIINGSVVYGTCCEPVSGNLFALSAAGVDPTPLAPGYWPTPSDDQSRLASLNAYSFEVWDLAGGQRTSRAIDADEQLLNAQQLAWSSDASSVVTLRFDEQGWQLVRISTHAPFSVTGVADLDVGSPLGSSDSVWLVGFDADDNVVLDIRSGTTARLQSFDPDTLETVAGAWDGDHDGRFSHRLSPAGDVMLRWSEEGLSFERLDEPAVLTTVTGVRSAWFV